MRKILFTLAIVPFVFMSNFAQAEYEGTTVGLSIGQFAAVASGKETLDGVSTITTQDGAFKDSAKSIFVEVDLGRVSVGLDHILEAIESPENTNAVNGSTNTAKVEIDGVINLYATIDVIAGLYLKAGFTQAKITSLEKVTTNSQTNGTVGDQDIDGYTVGFGYKHDLDNGFQIRAEVNASEFDNFSVTDDSGDKYDFTDIYSARGIVSLAKTF